MTAREIGWSTFWIAAAVVAIVVAPFLWIWEAIGHRGRGAALALAFALAMSAQEPPKSLCGTDKPQYTANIDLLQISCVDYEALRERAPEVPWPAGKKTQVLVHVRAGDFVRIAVGGKVEFADLTKDAWGRLVAIVQFDGADHTAVDIKVLNINKE